MLNQNGLGNISTATPLFYIYCCSALIIMKKVLAKCLKTYPDEDDMQEYCDGKINEPCDIRVYHKGRKYYIVEDGFDPDYYEIILPKIYAD